MLLMLSLHLLPNQIVAAVKEPIEKEMPAEVKAMLTRLDEIKTIDRSNLNSTEKKALRKEVRDIKKNLRASNNGVYLSVGAIIIIILLLILLL